MAPGYLHGDARESYGSGFGLREKSWTQIAHELRSLASRHHQAPSPRQLLGETRPATRPLENGRTPPLASIQRPSLPNSHHQRAGRSESGIQTMASLLRKGHRDVARGFKART